MDLYYCGDLGLDNTFLLSGVKPSIGPTGLWVLVCQLTWGLQPKPGIRFAFRPEAEAFHLSDNS